MELEHRFEVPVGVEKAWATLLDMEKVGPCFPGATWSTSTATSSAARSRSSSGRSG